MKQSYWKTPFLKFSSEWCFQKRHVLVTCKVNIPRFGFISENSLKPIFGTRIGNIWFSWRSFHLLWCSAVKWNLSLPWTTYENCVRFRNNHNEHKQTVFWVDFRSFKTFFSKPPCGMQLNVIPKYSRVSLKLKLPIDDFDMKRWKFFNDISL